MATDDLAAFGKWLKQRREALDLTQKELADATGCSISTISKMEMGLRRPSKQIAELLAIHLQILPAEYAAFMQFARGNISPASADSPPPLPDVPPLMPASTTRARRPAPPPSSTSAPPVSPGPVSSAAEPGGVAETQPTSWPPPTNLPTPLTSFVERAALMGRIRSLLWRVDLRLLTLTGPPGIGKTRLAIEVASGALGEFADGVFLVSLAPIEDPALVLPAIAQVLAVPRDSQAGESALLDRLAFHLKGKNMLLVLDNFEHVVDAALDLARLLMAVGRLKALVTSTIPLHLSGEHEVVIPPMPVPEEPGDESPMPPSSLSRFESVQLFVRRAQAAQPDFALTPDNAWFVARICRRLDGLPLAIELAAGQCRLYTPRAILSRLQKRLDVLTGGARDLPARHKTLRAAIGWSYDLLGDDEQKLFRCLGVFVGGFSPVAAEYVTGSAEAREILLTLARKSLLTVDQEPQRTGDGLDDIRFAMLETIREFALEQLDTCGEEQAIRERHAGYFLQRVEEASAGMAGPRQAELLKDLEVDHDNIRAALNWLLDYEPGNPRLARWAVQMSAALSRFWYAKGYFSEGRAFVNRALANAGLVTWDRGDVQVNSLRAAALDTAGWLAWAQGDYADARQYFESGLALSRELGEKRTIARLLNGLAQLALDRLSYDEALASFGESMELARELGDKYLLARVANNTANVYRNTLDFASARRYYEQSLALFRELGDSANSVSPLTNLGLVSMDMGDYEAARRYQEEALSISRELDHRESLAFVLAFMGRRAVLEGDFDAARITYGEVLPLVREMSHKMVLAMCLEGLAPMMEMSGAALAAARLWGGAEAIRETLDLPLPLPDRAHYERQVATARERLGAAAFEAAWAEGRTMSASVVQTVAYALGSLASRKEQTEAY